MGGLVATHAALWVLLLSAPALGKEKRGKGPLCHGDFRALERCIGSDYDRLRAQCSRDYEALLQCLERDWKHIDDAEGYARSAGSFNRMKRCRHGVMLFNPMDWYIGRGLEVYGEWGEKKVAVMERLVKAGHIAVEVGAHVGALTLPLSRMVGESGRVVAFEPFYPSFSTLAANVGLNSLQNVEVRQAVVADKVGRVFMNRKSFAFKLDDFFNFGSISFNTLRIYDLADDVERASADWDEYATAPLDQMSLGRLDFVKIDAEAMEAKVIQGAMRIIKKFKPVLFVEYRNPWEKGSSLLKVLEDSLRYECILLRLPLFNGENFRKHGEDIWGINARLVSFNLLCKHRFWKYPDMDDVISKLFESAVDTDIPGLRTTPTVDPLENIPRVGSAAQKAGRSLSSSGREKAVKSPQPSKQPEEMSLDELLSEEPAPRKKAPAKTKPGRPESREMTLAELMAETSLQGDNAEEKERPDNREVIDKLDDPSLAAPSGKDSGLTLEELLGPDEEEGSADSWLGGASTAPKYEDMSLEELLALDSAAPQAARTEKKAKEKKKGGGKAGKEANGAKAAQQAAPRVEIKYEEELTLDEL